MSEGKIRAQIKILASMYDINNNTLLVQFTNFRDLVEDMDLNKVADIYKFLETVPNEYNYVRFLYGVLLILPYSTADCERGFSVMNFIKNDVRNRLGEVLYDLMFIAMYASEHEFDYDLLGAYVASEVWEYNKT